MGTRKTVFVTVPFNPNACYEYPDEIKMLGTMFVGMKKVYTGLQMPGQPPEVLVPEIVVVFAAAEHLIPLLNNSEKYTIKIREIDPKYLPKEDDAEPAADEGRDGGGTEASGGRPVLRLVGSDRPDEEG